MKQKPKTLTSDEVTLLSEHLGGMRNVTMALFMLDAGLRVNELVQLLVTDLWFEDRPVTSLIVRAEIAKNRRERTIPLSARVRACVVQMFTQWWRSTDLACIPYAFWARTPDVHITTRQVHRIIDAAAMKAYGRHCHPHMLRHTFASRLIKKCNSSIVQVLLGHSRLSSTQIYCHPDAEDLKNAIDSLD